MKTGNLVVGEDMNFSLRAFKIWGPHAQEDPMAMFFATKFTQNRLIDLNLIQFKPTFRNRHTISEMVEKRLGRFLMVEDMADKVQLFRQWVGSEGHSNHHPIFLKIKSGISKTGSPFNFTSSWL